MRQTYEMGWGVSREKRGVQVKGTQAIFPLHFPPGRIILPRSKHILKVRDGRCVLQDRVCGAGFGQMECAPFTLETGDV